MNIEFADSGTGAEPVCGHACVLADVVHFDLMNVQHGQAVLVPEIVLLVGHVKFHSFMIPFNNTPADASVNQ